MRNLKEIRIIEWVDSSTSRINGWIAHRDYDPVKCISATTVGFIIYEDTNIITIAHSISEDEYLGEISIPKCSIIKIREITAVSKSK